MQWKQGVVKRGQKGREKRSGSGRGGGTRRGSVGKCLKGRGWGVGKWQSYGVDADATW